MKCPCCKGVGTIKESIPDAYERLRKVAEKKFTHVRVERTLISPKQGEPSTLGAARVDTASGEWHLWCVGEKVWGQCSAHSLSRVPIPMEQLPSDLKALALVSYQWLLLTQAIEVPGPKEEGPKD